MSDATPIKILPKFSKNVPITRKKIDGSGITPSYFPALMKYHFWSYPSFHYITPGINYL